MKIKLNYKLLLIITLSIIVAYFTLSKLTVGRFINTFYYFSDTPEESINSNVFIKQFNIDRIEIKGDHNFEKFIQDSLIIWIDKCAIKRSYGLLNMFTHEIIEDNCTLLRLRQKKDLSVTTDYNIRLQENSKGYQLEYFNGIFIKNSENKTIRFFERKTDTLIGQITISLQ